MSTKPPPRPTRVTFSDELRDAIERSGSTPYAIGKASGVDPGILSRFLSGRRGVTSETIDRLASYLGLHLAAATRPRGRPRREPAPSRLPATDAWAESDGPEDENPGEDATVI